MSNFQDHPPPVYLRLKFLKEPPNPSSSSNDNQLIKRNHDPRRTIICYQQSNYRIIHHLQWFLLTCIHFCIQPVSFAQLDLAHALCNVIIKRWLHCLTSESKRRFLVNNILMFGSTCLVMAQIQLKKNDWTSRTLATDPRHLQPLCPITSYFCLTPHSFKVDIMCITPFSSCTSWLRLLTEYYLWDLEGEIRDLK